MAEILIILFIPAPLTLAVGVLRKPFWNFLALVTFAKTARHLIVAAITLNIT